MTPEKILAQYFGHQKFRDGQREVIDSLLHDRSALAIFPTGGGKSLCYQLPALVLDGLTLVISPLIALMKDQVDSLTSRSIAAARLDSTLTGDETRALYQQLSDQTLKILYVAPERLANETFRQRLNRTSISLLAIDEAHCISEWGHNFRPDYLKLAQLAHELKIPRVLCLTATATPKVAADIQHHFHIHPNDHHQLTFHRPNLHLAVTPLREADKKTFLLDQLRSAPTQSTIIYTTLQFGAESLASFLNQNGLKARPYHAGLRPEVRSEIQDDFMADRTPIICATIAFGMGIDKPDIRSVIHYNLPKSLENYTQEIGRAGRDGLPATCHLLACQDDLRLLANFTYGDTPQASSLQALVRYLLDQPTLFDLSLYDLSLAHDIRINVLRSLLTYLELDGHLAATAPFYASYQVAFTRSLDHLLKGFDPDRQAFLTRLFETGQTGGRQKKWLEINPAEAATTLNEPQDRIVRALSYLEDLGDLTLKPAKVRQGYRRLPSPDQNLTPHDLAQRLTELFHQRETSDLARLQQVVDYALSPTCLTAHLLSYFGEKIPPCGHCDRCLGKTTPANLPASPTPEITPSDLTTIHQLIKEKHPGLRSARQIARFLCGMTSPATSYAWYLPPHQKRKSRLTSHPAYALLESHDFQDVLLQCQTLIIP